MRLFVSIPLSDEMKKAMIDLMHEMKQKGIKGNYVPIKNLHLTLCFIGESTQRKEIEQALARVSFKPFRLAVTELGNFGDLLWIGTRGGQAISTLASDIRKELTAEGIAFDEKKFTPHITLIRKFNGSYKGIKVPKSEMKADKFSLMKSERGKTGMVYTELRSFGKPDSVK